MSGTPRARFATSRAFVSVADRLDNMSFEERQEILRLVVDRFTVENGTARIDTVIPGPKDEGQLRARRSELVEPQRCGGLGPFRQ